MLCVCYAHVTYDSYFALDRVVYSILCLYNIIFFHGIRIDTTIIMIIIDHNNIVFVKTPTRGHVNKPSGIIAVARWKTIYGLYYYYHYWFFFFFFFDFFYTFVSSLSHRWKTVATRNGPAGQNANACDNL